MKPELLNIIKDYLTAIENLFPRVANHLKVELPITNTEWTCIKAEQRGETQDGIKYFIHGYGISMNDGKVKVDFDIGDKGQINGFDAWRLSSFVEENNIKTIFSNDKEIEKAIKDAEASGELKYSGYILYYLTKNL